MDRMSPLSLRNTACSLWDTLRSTLPEALSFPVVDLNKNFCAVALGRPGIWRMALAIMLPQNLSQLPLVVPNTCPHVPTSDTVQQAAHDARRSRSASLNLKQIGFRSSREAAETTYSPFLA